jgi:amino acid adenylation domain-containing protein
MKTGAAYLPLDPSCPSERIRLILEDARVPIVISNSPAKSRLPSGAWQVVDPSASHESPRIYPPAPLSFTAKPSQLAYVIYTSGSTGRPKGVEITLGNLSNLVQWHQCAFAVCPSDRATILASPGFDASVWEVWPYLTAGATLHMPTDATRVSPRALRDWMLSNGITISFVPTPIAQRLLLLDWPAETPLRFLLTGADTLQQYPRSGLPFTLVNNYGPTECTVVSTSCAVTHRDHPSALPPIGRPIANTQVFVLDEHLQQVPQGSVGELHIAGANVGRGYLNNPKLTQEKFIPNPFSSERGSRLYKTGDLVRPLADGNLEFVGRADDQVKIRGYRVEPNEVSQALCKHEAVETGIVVARKDRKGKHVLVAYVLPKPGFALNLGALRAHLQYHLPDYMIPNAFVLMHIFPLTTNGKVDRSALPPPNAANTLPNAVARSTPETFESASR